MTFFKRTTCLLALAISVYASAQDTPKDKKDWQQLGRYETANLEVTADSDNSRRVLFSAIQSQTIGQNTARIFSRRMGSSVEESVDRHPTRCLPDFRKT